jgi:hypothetical protein
LPTNLANFLRTLALPADVEHWSLTTLREKLVKNGTRSVRHDCYVVFQLAEAGCPEPCSPRSCVGSIGSDPNRSRHELGCGDEEIPAAEVRP